MNNDRYPHKCTVCGAPAYLGEFAIECSGFCRHRDPRLVDKAAIVQDRECNLDLHDAGGPQLGDKVAQLGLHDGGEDPWRGLPRDHLRAKMGSPIRTISVLATRILYALAHQCTKVVIPKPGGAFPELADLATAYRIFEEWVRDLGLAPGGVPVSTREAPYVFPVVGAMRPADRKLFERVLEESTPLFVDAYQTITTSVLNDIREALK